jgi:hypothetical protein
MVGVLVELQLLSRIDILRNVYNSVLTNYIPLPEALQVLSRYESRYFKKSTTAL